MKLLIEKKILIEKLEKVSKALSTRNIIPVLNGIKFELKKEGLFLLASDTEITIQTFVNKKEILNIEEEGSFIVYGQKLLEFLRKLDEEKILIEYYNENEVIFNKGIGKLNCLNISDFPNIKFEKEENPLILDSLKLKEMINKTSFACSTQESRPLLTGVNIKLIGNIFELVATDSYRLSRYQCLLDKINHNNFNKVIPYRNINELSKIIDDGEIYLHIFDNKILFEYNDLIFQTSLLNGTYPNTDNSIPNDFKHNIIANYKEFYNLIDIASLFTQIKEKNIIEMVIEENKLHIIASGMEIGKFNKCIDIDNINNTNINISFSAKYMLDALKIYNDEKINILLNGEISPIILKENNNSELIELILPMKTF